MPGPAPAARILDPVFHTVVKRSGHIAAAEDMVAKNKLLGEVWIECQPAAYVTCTVLCTGLDVLGLIPFPKHPPAIPPPPIPHILDLEVDPVCRFEDRDSSSRRSKMCDDNKPGRKENLGKFELEVVRGTFSPGPAAVLKIDMRITDPHGRSAGYQFWALKGGSSLDPGVGDLLPDELKKAKDGGKKLDPKDVPIKGGKTTFWADKNLSADEFGGSGKWEFFAVDFDMPKIMPKLFEDPPAKKEQEKRSQESCEKIFSKDFCEGTLFKSSAFEFRDSGGNQYHLCDFKVDYDPGLLDLEVTFGGVMELIEPIPPAQETKIVSGSASVFIHNRPAARWNDVAGCEAKLGGNPLQWLARNVFIGD